MSRRTGSTSWSCSSKRRSSGRARPSSSVLHPIPEGKNEASTHYPADWSTAKRGVGVVIVGEAVAQKPASFVDVAMKIRGRSVALRVHGERVYDDALAIGPAAKLRTQARAGARRAGSAARDARGRSGSVATEGQTGRAPSTESIFGQTRSSASMIPSGSTRGAPGSVDDDMPEEARLESAAFPAAAVVRVEGEEAVNSLPRFRVELLSPTIAVDLRKVVGEPVSLALRDRAIQLVVVGAAYEGAARDGHRYALELGAFVAPLDVGRGYRLFQKKTAQEIVADVLRDADVQPATVRWHLQDRYVERVQCVQYAESPWSFVARIAADDGINFWLDHDDDGACLVFADHAAAHPRILGSFEVPYVEPSGLVPRGDSFFELCAIDELAVESVHVRDYDPRHPDVLVDGRFGEGPLEHFEYPARVFAGEAATARAKRRLEQLRSRAVRLEGRSTCARLQPGRVVRIVGDDDNAFDGEFLVTRIAHDVRRATSSSGRAHAYENRVELVPAATPFRPPLPREVPKIDGLETATVAGPRGEEIHVNDLGSVVLVHRWDPSGAHDERASRWVRTLQWNMESAMMLPRVGFEVATAYVDGSPDEPIVLGQLWNGAHRPPYPLSAHKAVSCIKSATSPGGGSSHEVRFGDGAGGQEVFVHATNTHAVTVGGSQTNTVSANHSHEVATSLTIGAATQSTSIGGSQKVGVGTDEMITAAARTLSVGASEDLGTKQSAVVSTGSYSELIGALYTLRCTSSYTTVQGAHTLGVGGPITLTAALGTHHSTAAARTELVAGPRNIVAMSDCVEDVTGIQTTNVGSCSEITQKTVTECKTLSLDVATLDVKAGAHVVLAGSTVSIKASSLAVSGGSSLKVAGSIQASGGAAKVDASSTTMKSGEKAAS